MLQQLLFQQLNKQFVLGRFKKFGVELDFAFTVFKGFPLENHFVGRGNARNIKPFVFDRSVIELDAVVIDFSFKVEFNFKINRFAGVSGIQFEFFRIYRSGQLSRAYQVLEKTDGLNQIGFSGTIGAVNDRTFENFQAFGLV